MARIEFSVFVYTWLSRGGFFFGATTTLAFLIYHIIAVRKQMHMKATDWTWSLRFSFILCLSTMFVLFCS